jgi:hypothetical protein
MKKYSYYILSLILCSCSSGSGDDTSPPPDVTNVAPTIPTLVYPTNNLLCINNTLDFEWNASTDSNNDNITYTIQVSKDNQFAQIDFASTTLSTIHTFTLEIGIAYYWRVKATDSNNASSNFSSTYNLYTEGEGVSNYLPFSPELVSPLLNTIQQSGTINLEWIGSDTDNDPLTFDVYFGTENPPTTLVSENQNETNINVNTISASDYYWKVVVKDDKGGITIGQVWNFKTN